MAARLTEAAGLVGASRTAAPPIAGVLRNGLSTAVNATKVGVCDMSLGCQARKHKEILH